MKKGMIWEYSGESYSMAIQWRRILYDDTVANG